jgi:PIN domain nuclease of toxin-antitoxin system
MAFLENYGGRCVISPISVWEIGMLVAKRRLTLKPTVAEWVDQNLEPPVFLQPIDPGQ